MVDAACLHRGDPRLAPCPCRSISGPSGSARSGRSTTRSGRAKRRRGRVSTGSGPAAEDRFRICLVAVDIQNTFCTPGFELFVPGAVEDSRRLCEFVYRNLAVLTEIVPTLDTHQAIQIFHAAFLVDAEGQPAGAVHADLGRGRGERPLDDRPGHRGRSRPPPALHAGARGRRTLPAHRLALPRDARRDRARARLGGRGGLLLPRDRAPRAARVRDQGLQPADRALLGARAGGLRARRTRR